MVVGAGRLAARPNPRAERDPCEKRNLCTRVRGGWRCRCGARNLPVHVQKGVKLQEKGRVEAKAVLSAHLPRRHRLAEQLVHERLEKEAVIAVHLKEGGEGGRGGRGVSMQAISNTARAQ